MEHPTTRVGQSSEACRRRWYTTWTTCPCETCHADRLRMTKLARFGRWERVPSEQAWEVLDRMIARGWSTGAIASASGVPLTAIHGIQTARRKGHRTKLGAVVARAIIGHGEPKVGYVDAVGSMRRLRALAWLGHSHRAIADVSGVAWPTLASIRQGRTKAISVHVAAGIDRAWRDLGMTVGSSEKTRRQALRAEWPPPLAWDDIDIDDPASTPDYGGDVTTSARGMPAADLIEAVTELLDVGVTAGEIGDRLGMQVDSIYQQLRRKGRKDLVRRMSPQPEQVSA